MSQTIGGEKLTKVTYLGKAGRNPKVSGAELTRPGSYGSSKLVALAALPKGASEEEVILAVRQVAEAATDFSWLSRGDVVFIKVASNSPNRYPATTSPVAVRAMAYLLRDKGASKVIVGDKPGVQYVFQDEKGQRGSSRDILTKNGLHQAAQDSGAEVHYFDEAGYHAYFADRPEHGSNWKGPLMLPKILTEVDHVVLLPRVSRHVLAGSTNGLKAAVGWLRDDSRLELHRDAKSFLKKIVEINDATVLREKLRMVLTVATKVQTTFGPDRGFVVEPEPGLVFGSESLLAHDMVALGWLLWNRERATPPSHLSWYRDPYQFYPGAMNRAFVGTIWGFQALLRSETYHTMPILSVRTDPLLSQAASLWGGIPQLNLQDVSGMLPEEIREYLLQKVTA
jgi:uncharacterized protein (DUF362 family)